MQRRNEPKHKLVRHGLHKAGKISRKQQMEHEKMEIRMAAKANAGAQKNKDSSMISPVVIVQIFH